MNVIWEITNNCYYIYLLSYLFIYPIAKWLRMSTLDVDMAGSNPSGANSDKLALNIYVLYTQQYKWVPVIEELVLGYYHLIW